MRKILCVVLAVSIVGAAGCKKGREIIAPDVIVVDSIVSSTNQCNCEFLNKVYITAKNAPEITVIGTPAKAAVKDHLETGAMSNRFIYFSYRDNAKAYQIYMKNNWYTIMQNVIPKLK